MGQRIGALIRHTLLASFTAVMLCPLVWVFHSSFKPNKAIIASPWGYPDSWTLSHYVNIWTGTRIGLYVVNSLYISAISAGVAVLLASATAFAMTRMKFPRASRLISGMLLLSLIIPANALLVPLYSLLRQLHLYNTPLALLLPYITLALPTTVFLVAAAFAVFPVEWEEAGMLDGLSAYGLFGRIAMPVLMPIWVTAFILNFLNSWNEFMMANLFLSKEALRTLPVGMAALYDQFNMNYGSLCAAIVLGIAPVAIMYGMLQKRMIEGMTAGHVRA